MFKLFEQVVLHFGERNVVQIVTAQILRGLMSWQVTHLSLKSEPLYYFLSLSGEILKTCLLAT